MDRHGKGAPPYVWLLGSLASLLFLGGYGVQAVAEGFTTGRIVRLAFWTVFLVVCVALLVRARRLKRRERERRDEDEG